jgi:hypothetical protein
VRARESLVLDELTWEVKGAKQAMVAILAATERSEIYLPIE